MQALTASKEQSLKTFAVQITKLPNTMASSCSVVTALANGYGRRGEVDSAYFREELDRDKHDGYFENRSEMEMPKKKRGRQKKTVPKLPQDIESCCNGMDVNMEAMAAFSEDNRHGYETPNSFLDSVCADEEEDDDEEEIDVQDFRRFSSRMRKPTSFFGVMDKNHRIGGSDRQSGSRNGRKRRGAGVKRMLQFDNPADILVIRPRPLQKPELQERDLRPQAMEKGSHLEDKTGTESQQYQTEEQQLLFREKSELELQFPIGTMTWGKLLGYDWWPGCVISHDEGSKGKKEKEAEENPLTKEEDTTSAGPQFWIKWFGDNQLSQISIDRLAKFEEFKVYFKPHHMKGIYKKGVIAALKEAAKRCKKEFVSRSDDKKLRWIVTEGCPIPKLVDDKKDGNSEQENDPVKVEVEPNSNNTEEQESKPVEAGADVVPTESRSGQKPRSGRKEKGIILLTSLEQEMIDWAMNGFLPSGPAGLLPTEEQQIPVQVVPMGGDLVDGGGAGPGGTNEGDEPPRKRPKMMLLQVKRKARFDSVKEGKISISELCIGCGDMCIVAEHPLFEGGFCVECKENFMECTYLFDEDGTQMYCTICSGGDEVFMCDAENCAKVYCGPCIEKLCGAEELEKVKAADHWLCFMCTPDCNKVGLLARREDWVHKLRELFLNDNEMEYDPLPFYPPLPPEERRPIRVLGLFDGIATGLLVLKELGIEVAKYVSSEIDMDAMYVSRVEHKEIVHVGDIERITEKEVKAWGPFDLVMGGSPCNDLSIVNPARKGIYEGTGRLFFEFFRVLSYTRPSPDENRPFFWLFENVVSMRAGDKRTISRFLQCNPVVIDAKEISAAHRARYFWGNLPGMNRPTIPRPGDRLTLQECLEPNCFRQAQFTKLRTITTKMNSIKQTKKAIYPVKIEGQAEDEGDVLWCTEMERLFGFPEHYTDVANLGRCGRQRLLGKAWSVPVIRHLLSPLKDYFKSSTTKETGITSCNPCNPGT